MTAGSRTETNNSRGQGMKLAFLLTDYFPYGGLQRDCLAVARECVRRGHEAEILTRTWQSELPGENRLSVRLFGRKGLTNEGRNRRFFRQLREHLTGSAYDLVVAFNRMDVPMDVYFGSDPCFEAKTQRLKPAWFRLTPRYRHFRNLEEHVFSKDARTRILLLTDHEISTYRDVYGTEPERFHVLPPGIKRREFSEEKRQAVRREVRRELGLAETATLLLFVGSGFRVKGLDRVIRATAALADDDDGIHLAIVGNGDPKSYASLAEEIGLRSRVHFLGAKPDVEPYMLAADALVHPAHSESAGMVLVEALTLGLPLVATDTCGYASHVLRSGGGTVIGSPFKQEELVRQLREILKPEVNAMHREAGLRYAGEQDLYSCHERAVDIIEEVARERLQA